MSKESESESSVSDDAEFKKDIMGRVRLHQDQTADTQSERLDKLRQYILKYQQFKVSIYCWDADIEAKIEMMTKEFSEAFQDVVFININSHFEPQQLKDLAKALKNEEIDVFKGKKFILNVTRDHSIYNVLNIFKTKTIECLHVHEELFLAKNAISTTINKLHIILNSKRHSKYTYFPYNLEFEKHTIKELLIEH